MRRGPVAAAGGVAVVGAVVLAVGFWPGGDGTGTDGTAPSGGRSAAAPSTSPTKSYALSKAPATIPAVREHTAARGPGWRPAEGKGRVVVGDGDLADEAKLLADELKLTYGGESDPRKGDVQLTLTDGDEGKDKGGDKGKGGAESYTLTVKGEQVRIAAPAEAGVFYGTRTLKQAVSGGRTAPEGVVRDRPAKPQRGFMIDIARKHFDLKWLEDRIRDLGDLKYNQLGLHFSDDQAFRIESDSHPEIVSSDHLTKDQVRGLLKLAASRHITVVPEIDSPGHLGAVIREHPSLQLRSARGTVTRGAVDISKPEAAKIVDDLLKEYAELFPGAYWHLGADEYLALTAKNPEASYPQLAAAARERYGAGGRVQDLATGWLNDRADTVRPSGKKLKAWNDGFFGGGTTEAADDLEVAYWTGKEIGAREPDAYLKAGRKLVNYNDEYLYYVLGQPQTFRYPTGQRIYESWTPLVVRGTKPVSERYDDQILGGTFAVWGDLADAQTQEQVAAGIRMPLRATVQKLWDPRKPALAWNDFVKLADGLR
ncbi:beta-N-acetylhexosaminidase [Streptomyces sp. Je 1-369]|uniref:beta-N-acetylhexosaminidase n=1 Tax=Streptomyces sp. Je 1-369 TaxID=2966192 RepID=UPI0022863F04|nr:glycoside hydrolase family 20 protein [Streptomyces sp. Je 1-369]WAL97455.1 family 20 glycosylhydrolase [Streptomyces sp. Je 1-369]